MSVLKNTQLGSNSPALEKPAECWPRIQNPMANISEAIVWGKQCREGGLGLIGWLQSILFRPLYPYSMTANFFRQCAGHVGIGICSGREYTEYTFFSPIYSTIE